jgi:hypothetical protein
MTELRKEEVPVFDKMGAYRREGGYKDKYDFPIRSNAKICNRRRVQTLRMAFLDRAVICRLEPFRLPC